MEREGGCPCSEDLLRRDVPDSLPEPGKKIEISRPVTGSFSPRPGSWERESSSDSAAEWDRGNLG
ncbi:hypothetical protein A3B52_01600 [Candidatus Curtissbacteria bacterium RIFCSPLOWO2_01_FULL_41_28]|uniref:Uncharacterized protein n=2 Tax=Patescibacteria group TaxID=1783273 RepID=A0A0G1ZL98_9BACT|nr:MAG: hypothetical protein UY72_C0060G0001 [Candidatus Uhrbacteria bacterium GW2011_GWD2_52_7]OGD78589.1 MAG: hypothetical protein A2683_02340 [Candidatus Curtissbacteria bacterium RIFCSPHIGHO2_01_FULL_34_40]OGD92602.1 MAG: hypothetical protein A3E14_03550 [Candidatus Curtissbacteria bacterium RIFCSPHIGHO2_12_FULL_41_13]OGD95717.1 MAG: hypothetical protein A3B52_01600 [Candidatus Curtissbacteria bacterium RIFCSPLOWO2_01_FULL_41_28]OGE01604.1 MAG: hypothetical protein A2196_01820 [Candidatus C